MGAAPEVGGARILWAGVDAGSTKTSGWVAGLRNRASAESVFTQRDSGRAQGTLREAEGAAWLMPLQQDAWWASQPGLGSHLQAVDQGLALQSPHFGHGTSPGECI